MSDPTPEERKRYRDEQVQQLLLNTQPSEVKVELMPDPDPEPKAEKPETKRKTKTK
jgi:hypothetical protein